ncbi:MAG TPA: fused MFS/spermidine synthase [Thermoanaerobaculia bacterium]|nr:fused MFS/spermidine synthase [Thermoanaerobaculia bacterium]
MTEAEQALPAAGANTPAAARGTLWRACSAAFIASFCMLVIELVAARIMAPYVGVSLYTWTSIIGVILAGISIGAWAGGALADRRPRTSTLAFLFLLSGATAVFIAPLADLIGNSPAVERLAPTLLARVLFIAVSVFFVPAFLLGTISPVTVKLALADLHTSGGVVGKIYAFSTLGSIVGTFATGFVLIAWLGTRTVLLCVAAALFLSALAFSGLLRRVPVLLALVAAAGALGFAGPDHVRRIVRSLVTPISYGEYYYGESAYYTIRLSQAERLDHTFLEVLVLDHLVHSFNDLRDPSDLRYAYLRLFDDIVRWKLREKPNPRLLFLGGGGYTLPRYLAASVPGASIDVVEIDPAVTRVAIDYLGVDPHGSIHTVNQDARWFVMNTRKRYDAIFCDAFNDLSIPFHLTTREFNARLTKLLEPRGFVAANVIDNYQRGEFLPAYANTIRSVFGPQNVALLGEWPATLVDMQGTFVVVASPDTNELRTFLRRPVPPTTTLIGPRSLSDYLRPRHPLLLTDDYAPVDNLLAKLFEQRYRYRAQ